MFVPSHCNLFKGLFPFPFCRFLSVFVNYCPFLSVSVPLRPFMSVSVCFWLFMSVSVRFCPCLSFSLRFCPFLSFSVCYLHFLLVSVPFCPFGIFFGIGATIHTRWKFKCLPYPGCPSLIFSSHLRGAKTHTQKEPAVFFSPNSGPSYDKLWWIWMLSDILAFAAIMELLHLFNFLP